MVLSLTAIKQLKTLQKHGSPMRLAAQNWNADWKTLIAIMMSAQTRDEVTIIIATQLFEKYPTLEKLADAKYADVLSVLKSLNYNQTKSKHLIACAKMLTKKYHGKVPLDLKELVSLPGVGNKTANVFLSEMGGDALGVDTHVAYIAQKMGWTNNKNPDKIEKDLKKLFPKKKWSQVNDTLVRFGKTHRSKKKKDALLKMIKEKN